MTRVKRSQAGSGRYQAPALAICRRETKSPIAPKSRIVAGVKVRSVSMAPMVKLSKTLISAMIMVQAILTLTIGIGRSPGPAAQADPSNQTSERMRKIDGLAVGWLNMNIREVADAALFSEFESVLIISIERTI